MGISEKAEDGTLRLYIYDFTGVELKDEWTVDDRDCDRDGDAWIQTDLTADEGKAVVAFLEEYRRQKGGKDESSDKFCRELWNEMEDVPFDEDSDGKLVLGQNFYTWKKGTPREKIWQWFNAHYSRGVASLLYTQGE